MTRLHRFAEAMTGAVVSHDRKIDLADEGVDQRACFNMWGRGDDGLHEGTRQDGGELAGLREIHSKNMFGLGVTAVKISLVIDLHENRHEGCKGK